MTVDVDVNSDRFADIHPRLGGTSALPIAFSFSDGREVRTVSSEKEFDEFVDIVCGDYVRSNEWNGQIHISVFDARDAKRPQRSLRRVEKVRALTLWR